MKLYILKLFALVAVLNILVFNLFELTSKTAVILAGLTSAAVFSIVVISFAKFLRPRTVHQLSEAILKLQTDLTQYLVLDSGGKIKEIDGRYLGIVGYSRDELLGRHFSELVSGTQAPDFSSDILKKISQEGRWLGDICIKKKNKELLWLRTSIAPLGDSRDANSDLICLQQDVTATYRLQEEARNSHATMELALRCLEFSTFEFDLSTQNLRCDDNCFGLFGVSKDGFDNRIRHFQRCIQTHDLLLLRDRFLAAINDKDRTDLVELDFGIRRHSDNSKRIIQLEAKPQFDHEGRPAKVIGILRDVTDSREKEGKLIHSAKMASLGEMASGIAHEVNNPLTVILGKVSVFERMLENGNFDADRIRTTTASIKKTAERIAKIIRGLRSFARDDSSDSLINSNVEMIVKDTLELCQSRLVGSGIELKVNIPTSSDLRIECRPGQISQILLNLLNNSVDAVTPLSDRWIRLEVQDRGEEVEISITDSGAGIPRTIRDKVLQPFFTTKEVGKGTGLGLSISLGIAKAHKGELSLDETSANTRFILRIPKRQSISVDTRSSSLKSA